MRGRFQPPMFAVAAALLGLIVLLAALQYRWLGRISDAERERMTSTLQGRAAAFAADFDRELTLAFMTFQADPIVAVTRDADPVAEHGTDRHSARLAERRARWQATARHPRLIETCYLASRTPAGGSTLQQLDAAGALVPTEWPQTLADVRRQIQAPAAEIAGRAVFIRTLASPLWEDVPAIVVPSPIVFADTAARGSVREPTLSFTILLLDRDYIVGEMLPALAGQHFREPGGAPEYRLAVHNPQSGEVIYQSDPHVRAAGGADVTADLFTLRTHEFAQFAADARRFFAAASEGERLNVRDARIRSLVIEEAIVPGRGAVQTDVPRAAGGRTPWQLRVVHPSGSLEAAVASVRQRNLLISTGVLAVLSASMGLLLVSTRRAQQLARQQLEFVAAVSHELRTPLAVIRAAGDNLADGTVLDEPQVRRYGALVRSEGRRLTGMVEQILEFAGIQSGQRALEIEPLPLGVIVADVLRASAPLIEAARITVDVDVSEALPLVAGDQRALTRVFQNLIDNAVKYGEDGRWIGIEARADGSLVRVSISDRGRGIPASDQPRIFEPFYRAGDVVAAQIQGAGLGLSLVQRIVEAHGGRIAVRSAPGQGSTFIVHLPAAVRGAANRAHAGGAAASDHGGPADAVGAPST